MNRPPPPRLARRFGPRGGCCAAVVRNRTPTRRRSSRVDEDLDTVLRRRITGPRGGSTADGDKLASGGWHHNCEERRYEYGDGHLARRRVSVGGRSQPPQQLPRPRPALDVPPRPHRGGRL